MNKELADKIFKILQKCNRNYKKEDLHTFKADIKEGSVYVECRGYEIYIIKYDWHGKRTEWSGTTVAAANYLSELEINLFSIDI